MSRAGDRAEGRAGRVRVHRHVAELRIGAKQPAARHVLPENWIQAGERIAAVLAQEIDGRLVARGGGAQVLRRRIVQLPIDVQARAGIGHFDHELPLLLLPHAQTEALRVRIAATIGPEADILTNVCQQTAAGAGRVRNSAQHLPARVLSIG